MSDDIKKEEPGEKPKAREFTAADFDKIDFGKRYLKISIQSAQRRERLGPFCRDDDQGGDTW